MAVYTQIREDELKTFLDNYDLGTLVSFHGIEQGVENTNYHLFTTSGRYILTLFEKRVDPDDLPFFFAFTGHLSGKGILCPSAVPDTRGRQVGVLCNRPAVITVFLEGRGLERHEITPEHCSQLGSATARMHLAARDFSGSRPNSMGLPAWKALADKTRALSASVDAKLPELIDSELEFLEARWPSGLPSAVAHLDIFPDNVFFRQGRFAGMIDYYFSATDILAYDLALVINAWCFDDKDQFLPDHYDALLLSYGRQRPLSVDEEKNLPFLCRAAAMRILMTRLHDWVFHPADALVRPKDPREYITKLRFHQQDGLNSHSALAAHG